MSQPPLRIAFLAARPLRQSKTPSSYLQTCRACRARLSTSASASASSYPVGQPKQRRPSATISALRTTPRRRFSQTAAPRATVVLQNPRTDDDGKDMTIEISDRAARRLRQITSAPAPKNTLIRPSSSSQDAHLRVTVTSGGCHGFQYLMALEDASKVDRDEDTIFTYSPPEADVDAVVKGKAEVVMDSASLELLKGSTIDFTQELIGSQFKVVGNPRATSSCGCGTSFDIE